MEPRGKRTYSTMMDESSCKEPIATYMNKIGEELEGILYAEQQPSHEDLIRNSLVKLGHDVTDIKWTLEKKKPKVTLAQVNEKLDVIINLLHTPYREETKPIPRD